MEKCETCLNSRLVIYEGEPYYVCALHPNTGAKCLMNSEDNYVARKRGRAVNVRKSGEHIGQ